MASLEVENTFAHQNLRTCLFLTVGEVKKMIADKNDEILKLYFFTRELSEEDLTFLKAVSDKLGALYLMTGKEGGEKVFERGVEEICGCAIHVRHMKAAGVQTLADFLLPPNPERLMKELFLAEMEARESGLPRQPHLFTRLLSKITLATLKTLVKKRS